MDIGHAQRCQHGQVHDADAATEISTIDCNDELENRCAHQRGGGGVMREARRSVAGQPLAESEVAVRVAASRPASEEPITVGRVDLPSIMTAVFSTA